MENNEQRPSAALINREWYESAKGVLSARDLSCVVIAAVEYVLYGDTAIALQDSSKLVFAMIRPALDSDIAKYRERCARNAANAKSQRQRVAASGSESQRVAANTTTTTTTTTTPTSNQYLSSAEEVEREKWLIYGYFWSIGSGNVKEESNAFWSYYDSLGWRNNKGAAIVSKLSAAHMWRRQFETHEPKAGAGVWFNALKTCPVPDVGVWTCYAGAEMVDSRCVIRLRCNTQFLQDLEKILPDLRKRLKSQIKCQELEILTAD